MYSEYIDKINTHKKYFTLICMVIMVVLFNWILKDFSANILIHKLLIYLFFCFSLYIGLVVEKDWFSPFSLFSLFYFCLFIYSSRVSPHLLPKISDRSIFLILIGSSSFIFGLIAFKLLRSKLRSNKGLREKISNSKSYQPAYSYWILLLLGLTPTIISLASKGIPAVMIGGLSSKEIQDIRISFPIPILSMFTCLTNAALITAMSTRKKKVIIVVLSVALISSSMIFAKLDLVITLFFASYGIVRYKLISKKFFKWALCIGAVVFFFVLSQSYRYARGGESGELYVFEKYYIDYGSKYYSENMRDIYLTYMYMVTPFTNLDYILENHNNYTNGKMTFWSLISISQIKRIYGLKPIPKSIRVEPFNTHTFLADFYMDFGVVGIIVLPFLLGVIVYFFYSRVLISNDPLKISIYLYWGLATLMMFFSNHFTSVGYPIHYFIIIEVYRKGSVAVKSIFQKGFKANFV